MKLTNKTKIIVLICISVFFVFYFFAFRETTWGGWSPDSVALKLDSKEQKWVDDFEKINDCKVSYIGLDDAFMEDSIIHVDIFCNKNSSLTQTLVKQGAEFVKSECNSFLFSSSNKRAQRYIQFSFHDVKPKEKINSLKFNYLFDKDLDNVIKIE